MHGTRSLTTSRRRIQSDIWKVPVDGSPAHNTRRGTRITRQAQTPSVSPDESEVVDLFALLTALFRASRRAIDMGRLRSTAN